MLKEATTTLCLILLIGAIAGCTSHRGSLADGDPGHAQPDAPRAAVDNPRFSGFLGDYTGLESDPTDKSLLWFEVDDFNWLDYRGVMLDPLVIYFSKQAENRQIESDQIQMLADYFAEAVKTELGDEHPIVQEAAPDVLRIRAALTDIAPASPAVNVVTTMALPVRLDMGGASIEVEFLDSGSGERLAAMVDRKTGSRMKAWQGLSKWGDARAGFRQWAKELRIALETNPEPQG